MGTTWYLTITRQSGVLVSSLLSAYSVCNRSSVRLTVSSVLSSCSSIVISSSVCQSSTAGRFTLLADWALCSRDPASLLPPQTHTHTHTNTHIQIPLPHCTLYLPASAARFNCPAVCVWDVNYLYCQPPLLRFRLSSPFPRSKWVFLHSLFLPLCLCAACVAP